MMKWYTSLLLWWQRTFASHHRSRNAATLPAVGTTIPTAPTAEDAAERDTLPSPPPTWQFWTPERLAMRWDHPLMPRQKGTEGGTPA